MSDGTALLAAILAQPDEDTPRLEYADWLDEQGEHARAEFVRVQVELATNRWETGDEDAPIPVSAELIRYGELKKRESQLLNLHRDVWLASTDWPVGVADVWYRGFIASVTSAAADWITHADAILAQHPVTTVRLTTRFSLSHADDLCEMYVSRARLAPNGRTCTEILAGVWPGIEFQLPPG